jgi:hypothetical protein
MTASLPQTHICAWAFLRSPRHALSLCLLSVQTIARSFQRKRPYLLQCWSVGSKLNFAIFLFSQDHTARAFSLVRRLVLHLWAFSDKLLSGDKTLSGENQLERPS